MADKNQNKRKFDKISPGIPSSDQETKGPLKKTRLTRSRSSEKIKEESKKEIKIPMFSAKKDSKERSPNKKQVVPKDKKKFPSNEATIIEGHVGICPAQMINGEVFLVMPDYADNGRRKLYKLEEVRKIFRNLPNDGAP